MDVPEPKHRDASWNGESVVPENEHLRLVVYRRQGGWGGGRRGGGPATRG